MKKNFLLSMLLLVATCFTSFGQRHAAHSNIVKPDVSGSGIKYKGNDPYVDSGKYSTTYNAQLETILGKDSTTSKQFGARAFKVADSVFIKAGVGSPLNNLSAPVGSIFLRLDGSTSTTLYIKTAGVDSTGWTAK